MINLLPNEQKRDIRAGRANLLLARYSILTLVALALLLVIMGVAWLLLNNIKATAQTKIEESEQSSTELAKDIQAVNSFKSNLATAKQILDKEVDYSTIILRYASAIPSGAIIDHIDLDPSVVGTPSTFTAKVRNPEDAITLKNKLNNSPYFDNVYFTEIQQELSANDGFDYSVTVNVTINTALLNDEGIAR